MRKILSILCAVILMASCASSRKAQKSAERVNVVPTQEWKSGDALVAKGNFTINLNGKDISVSSITRMMRDDVIQVNLTYILGIQVGTMEITRDSLLFVDRINHQYTYCSFNDLAALGSGLNFQNMQQLFWGEAQPGSANELRWGYSGDFITMPNGQKLPKGLSFDIQLGTQAYRATISNNGYSMESEWEKRTRINTNRYTLVPITVVLQKLAYMAQ